MHAAIFTDSAEIEPRTVVLISLANGADLLSNNFGRKEIKNRKKRIEQIINGEITGRATKEAIAACQVALIVAVIMTAIIVSISSSK